MDGKGWEKAEEEPEEKHEGDTELLLQVDRDNESVCMVTVEQKNICVDLKDEPDGGVSEIGDRENKKDIAAVAAALLFVAIGVLIYIFSS